MNKEKIRSEIEFIRKTSKNKIDVLRHIMYVVKRSS